MLWADGAQLSDSCSRCLLRMQTRRLTRAVCPKWWQRFCWVHAGLSWPLSLAQEPRPLTWRLGVGPLSLLPPKEPPRFKRVDIERPPLDWGHVKVHCRRVCGIRDKVTVIFGKYNLPQLCQPLGGRWVHLFLFIYNFSFILPSLLT